MAYSVEHYNSFSLALADFKAAKEVIDAELYSKQKDIEVLEEMIDAYWQAFPTATEYQIMEMVKT